MSDMTAPGENSTADRVDRVSAAADKQLSAGQWQLMWWKFSRHKLAVASGVVLLIMYAVAILAELVATTDPNAYNSRYTLVPPQSVKLLRTTEDGMHFGFHTYGLKSEVDPRSLRRSFAEDPDAVVSLGFFVQGAPYKLVGLIPWDRHLIGPVDSSQPFYLMGSDRLGRDVFSRVVHGARVSLSLGLVGVVLSLGLGILLGGLSGYYGGITDVAIQRVIEFLISLPTIPLWMGLAAAIPLTWDPLVVYFLVTIILSLFGWTQLARQVRGLFFSLKNEDYVTAARLDGNSELRVITRHMVPAFTSHIIASVTLAIPAMILAETALSFLGIGLRSPVISWGVLLQEAQNIRSIDGAPWLLWPGLAVVIAVLALNFLGDGLRDAADPYEQN